MSIGSNLKWIRQSGGLSQTGMAKRLEISRTYLSDLENDRKSPSVDTLNKISKKLDVSTTFLLDGKYTPADLEKLRNGEVIPMHEWFESIKNSQIESAINYALDFVNNYKEYDSDSIFTISNLFKLIDTLNNLDQTSLKQPTIDFVGVLLQNLNYMVKNDSENDLKDFYQDTIDKTNYPK